MNEDQLYQQFLNNGGDASYEEFISLYQNFNSNSLDSEKKKNILQPEIPSNSQPRITALPISNDLELNTAQQEAIRQAQRANSLASDSGSETPLSASDSTGESNVNLSNFLNPTQGNATGYGITMPNLPIDVTNPNQQINIPQLNTRFEMPEFANPTERFLYPQQTKIEQLAGAYPTWNERQKQLKAQEEQAVAPDSKMQSVTEPKTDISSRFKKFDTTSEFKKYKSGKDAIIDGKKIENKYYGLKQVDGNYSVTKGNITKTIGNDVDGVFEDATGQLLVSVNKSLYSLDDYLNPDKDFVPTDKNELFTKNGVALTKEQMESDQPNDDYKIKPYYEFKPVKLNQNVFSITSPNLIDIEKDNQNLLKLEREGKISINRNGSEIVTDENNRYSWKIIDPEYLKFYNEYYLSQNPTTLDKAYNYSTQYNKITSDLKRGADFQQEAIDQFKQKYGDVFYAQYGVIPDSEVKAIKDNLFKQQLINNGYTEAQATEYINQQNKNKADKILNQAYSIIDNELKPFLDNRNTTLPEGSQKYDELESQSNYLALREMARSFPEQFVEYAEKNKGFDITKPDMMSAYKNGFYEFIRGDKALQYAFVNDKIKQENLNIKKAAEKKDFSIIPQSKKKLNQYYNQLNENSQFLTAVTQSQNDVTEKYFKNEYKDIKYFRELEAGYRDNNIGALLEYNARNIGDLPYRYVGEWTGSAMALLGASNSSLKEIELASKPFTGKQQKNIVDDIVEYKGKDGQNYELVNGKDLYVIKNGKRTIATNDVNPQSFIANNELKETKKYKDFNGANFIAEAAKTTADIYLTGGASGAIANKAITVARLLRLKSGLSETSYMRKGIDATIKFLSNPGTTSSYAMAMQYYGGSYQNYIQKGYDPLQAKAMAVFSTLALANVNKIFPDINLIKEVDSVGANVYRLLAAGETNAAKKFILNKMQPTKEFARNLINETAEESVFEPFAESVVQYMGALISGDREKIKNIDAPVDFSGETVGITAATVLLTALGRGSGGNINFNNATQLQKTVFLANNPEYVKTLKELRYDPIASANAEKELQILETTKKYLNQLPKDNNLTVKQTADVVANLQKLEQLKEEQQNATSEAIKNNLQSQIDDIENSIRQTFEASNKNKIDLNAKTGDQLITTPQEKIDEWKRRQNDYKRTKTNDNKGYEKGLDIPRPQDDFRTEEDLIKEFGFDKETTVNEFLFRLAESKHLSESQKAIVNKLKKYEWGTGLVKVDNNTPAFGYYNPTDNNVYFNLKALAYDKYGGIDRVGLHELMHYASYRGLRNDTEFKNGINNIFDVVKKQFESENGKKAEKFYGMKDTDELITEAFSNPIFQEYLKTVKYKNTTESVWEKFISYLNNLLGLKSNDTALSEIIALTSNNIDKNFEKKYNEQDTQSTPQQEAVQTQNTENPNQTPAVPDAPAGNGQGGENNIISNTNETQQNQTQQQPANPSESANGTPDATSQTSGQETNTTVQNPENEISTEQNNIDFLNNLVNEQNPAPTQQGEESGVGSNAQTVQPTEAFSENEQPKTLNDNQYERNGKIYTQTEDGSFTTANKNGVQQKVTNPKTIAALNQLSEARSKGDVVDTKESNGYVWNKYANGSEEIISPKGNIIKPNGKNKKGKTVTNANFTKNKARIFGEMTDNQIKKEYKKRIKEALLNFVPRTERELALLYFANGGKVSPASISKEIAGNNERREARGKKRSIEEYRWAWFGKQADASFENIAESIVQDEIQEFDQQVLRNELIDVVLSYGSSLEIQEEIVDLYNKSTDPYFGFTDEDIHEMEYQQLPENVKAIIDAERAEASLTEEEKFNYYKTLYENQIQSLSDAEQDQIYQDISRDQRGQYQSESIQSSDAKSDGRESSQSKKIATKKTTNSPEYQQLLKDRTAQESRVKSAKEKLDRVSKTTNKNFQQDQENLFGERQTDGGMFDERADANAGRTIIAEAKAEYDKERNELTRINNAIRDFENGNASGTGSIDFTEDTQIQTATQKIEDFGEKIGGAKKDLRQKLETITSKDIESNPLSKTLPKPEFQKIVNDGLVSPEEAIFLKYLYESIPSKPRVKWKVNGWVRKVESFLDIYKNLLDGGSASVNIEGVKKTIPSYSIYEAIHKELGIDTNLNGFDIKEFEGGRISVVRGSTIIKDYANLPDAIAGLKNIIAKAESVSKQKSIKFLVYQDTRSKKYFIGKKGANGVVNLVSFESSKDAFAFLKENQQQLEDMWNGMKTVQNERRDSNRERIGKDHRAGKNISPEEFQSTFGFRGVEFGNYVNNAERQSALNDSYDALMDMAYALGIEPRAISLNGELGLAFGARGSGGKNAASAHYEREKIVINLTKNKGAGSLAHEWWHALDNYFSRTRGYKDQMLTERPIQLTDLTTGKPQTEVRKEIIDAFKNIVSTITKSDLNKRSKEADKVRSKPYFGTPVEMSARAFENYVASKLDESGTINDYLVNFKDHEEWIKGGDISNNTYPYPTKEESTDINKTFQELFDTVEQRTADNGNVILYQLAQNNFTPLTNEAFQNLINRLQKAFPKFAKVTTSWDEFYKKAKSAGYNINFDANFSKLSDLRKQKQLALINEKNPAPNDYNTWIRNESDILTAQEAFNEAFSDGEMYPDFTVEDMQSALDSGKITIYSSYPIEEGVFVTPSRMNAESYSGDGNVYSKEVNVNDLAWIDQGEGQYAPVQFMHNANGTVYGAKLPDGTIYINPQYLNANTPIHEFSHLWEQLLPKAWAKGLEIFKQTKTGKDLYNQLKNEGNYNNLTDEQLWSEAMNTHIGNIGEERYQNPKGKMAQFMEWLRTTFAKLGEFLKFGGKLTPETQLKTFTEKVLGDLMGGKPVTVEKESDAQDLNTNSESPAQFNIIPRSASKAYQQKFEQARKMFADKVPLEKIWKDTGFFLRQNTNTGNWEWAYRIDQNKMGVSLPKDLKVGDTFKLGEVVNYPEFFTIFPDAKNTTVRVVNDTKRESVMDMSADGKTLTINLAYYNGNERSETKTKKTIAEEIQHYIQISAESGGGITSAGLREKTKTWFDTRLGDLGRKITNGNISDKERGRINASISALKEAQEYYNNGKKVPQEVIDKVKILEDKMYLDNIGEREGRLAGTDFTKSPYQSYNEDAIENGIDQKDFERETSHLRDNPIQRQQNPILNEPKLAKSAFDKLFNKFKTAFSKAFGEVEYTTDINEFRKRAKAQGLSDAEIEMMVVAFHGSPHRFDRFSTDYIGSGEGAQAFGWGLYFTDLESIARDYANGLSTIKSITGVPKNIEEDILFFLNNYLSNENNVENIVDLRNAISLINQKFIRSSTDVKLINRTKTLLDFLNKNIRNEDIKIKKNKNLYRVTLHKGKTPDQYTWLEWDKPVSKTLIDEIKKQIKKEGLEKSVFSSGKRIIDSLQNASGQYLYNNLKYLTQNTDEDYRKGKYNVLSDKDVSLFLLRAGIDGIKYPAESISRGATSDTAKGFNYVVFDENAVTIEEKVQFMRTKNGEIYGAKLPNGFMYFNPEKLNANTLVHEFSHLWEQMMPNAWKKGIELFKQTKRGKEIFAQLKKEGNYGTDENKIWSEALNTYLGEYGADKIRNPKGAMQKLHDWIKSFFAKIGEVTGFNKKYGRPLTAEDSFRDFADGVIGDIMGGKPLFAEANTQPQVSEMQMSLLSNVGTYSANNNDIRFSIAPKNLIPNSTINTVVDEIRNNGLEAGLTKFQESTWYKNLSPEQQSNITLDNYAAMLLESAKAHNEKKMETVKAKSDEWENLNTIQREVADPNAVYNPIKVTKRNRFNQFRQKWFNNQGGLLKPFMNGRDRAVGNTMWEIRTAKNTVEQLTKIAKKINFDNESNWKTFDNAMRGSQNDFNSLPDEIKPFVKRMRSQIDALSNFLVVNNLVTPQQAADIEANIGSYVTRGYSYFDGKDTIEGVSKKFFRGIFKRQGDIRGRFDAVKWADAVTVFQQNVLNEIATNKSGKYDDLKTEESRQSYARNEGERRLMEYIKSLEADFQKQGSGMGADVSTLKRRQDIPEPIRKLLGEFEDPRISFALTVAKVSQMAYQRKFLSDVRKIGMGTLFFKEGDLNIPKTHYVRISADGNESYSPLDGLYTTPEFKDVFLDIPNQSGNDLVKLWMAATGMVKVGKTVLSPITQSVNFFANFGFLLNNGTIMDVKQYGKAVQAFVDDISNGKINNSIIQELVEENILGQNVNFNEIEKDFGINVENELIRDIKRTTTVKNINAILQFPFRLYRASDDFFKAFSYYSEADRYAKSIFNKSYNDLTGEDRQRIRKIASEVTKNTLPNYDRRYKAADVPRKATFNLVGNFLAFQAESIRTKINSVQIALQDIKNPETRSVGIKRLAGIMAYNMTYGIITTYLMKSMNMGFSGLLGFFDDDDEEMNSKSFNRIVPDWARNTEKYMRLEKDGTITYWTYGNANPYGIWYKAANAAADSNSFGEGISRVFDEVLTPFLGTEMSVKWALNTFYKEENDYGVPLLTKDDKVNYTLDKLLPTAYKVIKDNMDSNPNNDFDIYNLAGIKKYNFNPTDQLRFRFNDVQNKINAIEKKIFSVQSKFEQGKLQEDEALKMTEDYVNEQKKIIDDFRPVYDAFLYFGADPSDTDEKGRKAYEQKYNGMNKWMDYLQSPIE